MKFLIWRTSDVSFSRNNNDKPCKNAKINKEYSKNGETVYEVNIRSLRDLMKLKHELGGQELIITNGFDGEDVIEIYDTFRE